MISWARYIVFDDEPTHLMLARNEKINEVKKKREKQKKENESDDESDDYMDLQDVFKGTNLKPFNIQNEIQCWQLIAATAEEAKALYPETLEYDEELIT